MSLTNENLEIASELLRNIAAAATSGESLALGPQAVKNLQGLISDLLQRADAQPDEPGGQLQQDSRDATYLRSCILIALNSLDSPERIQQSLKDALRNTSSGEPSPVHSEEWLRQHRCPPDIPCVHCNPENRGESHDG